MDTKKLPRISLVDQVYKDIKQNILTGKLPPNTKLIVRALCEQYDISDTPLKQALNRLISEGLVEAQPRKGMRVKQMTESDIHQSVEARLMIELYAAHTAIESIRKGTDLLKRLEKNILENEALISQAGDLGLYSDLAQREQDVSQRFHMLIVGSTNNKFIIETYCNIVHHTYIYYQSGFNKTVQARSSVEEHKRILECLRALDLDNLSKAIRQHLQIRENAATNAMTYGKG